MEPGSDGTGKALPRVGACASSAPGATTIWVTAHGVVYGVPREWAAHVHPGGLFSIVRNAGKCVDEAWGFHSAKARRTWAAFEEGRLAPCAHPDSAEACANAHTGCGVA